jgi:hypothetical protein
MALLSVWKSTGLVRCSAKPASRLATTSDSSDRSRRVTVASMPTPLSITSTHTLPSSPSNDRTVMLPSCGG